MLLDRLSFKHCSSSDRQLFLSDEVHLTVVIFPSQFQLRDMISLQKGTGKWTAITALNYGAPLTLIGEVFSICFFFSNYLTKLFRRGSFCALSFI